MVSSIYNPHKSKHLNSDLKYSTIDEDKETIGSSSTGWKIRKSRNNSYFYGRNNKSMSQIYRMEEKVV